MISALTKRRAISGNRLSCSVPFITLMPATVAQTLKRPSSRSLHFTNQRHGQAGLALKEDHYSHDSVYDSTSVIKIHDITPQDSSKRCTREPLTLALGAKLHNTQPYASYHVGRESAFERVPYWQRIPRWKDISEEQWLDYSWGVRHFLHLYLSFH